MTGTHIIILVICLVISYPLSHYLMTKGMTLDLSMPGNDKRYRSLTYAFRTPALNVVVMFIYLCYMLHKFKRV